MPCSNTLSRYVDAANQGAAQPDSENTIPIESVNVTPQEVKRALDNIPSEEEESDDKKTDNYEKCGKCNKGAGKSSNRAKKAVHKGIDRLEHNPKSSAFALAGILAAVIGTVGFVQQRKPGAVPITPQQGAIAAAGIALVSGGYYCLLNSGCAKCKK
ncbi:hypothetical protein DV451_004957 [Geotrichum candidum]|uniref:Uncharacterized protein n=1 Tax=Geotrichum candidum TaxID=1173061 RepID=A0A9P5G1J1_GEOCN|nr:hypothetical protein DV451_004957 [Geotrichum candidum]KAF5105226.1 hypothetical protein DV453_005034 [Geotrichum candidum]